MNVFDALFGCWHKNVSYPITTAKQAGGDHSPAADFTGSYVVCLDCGKEFAYDWEQGKVLSATSGPIAVAPQAKAAAAGRDKS
jgi:hypothetical protein